MEKDRIMKKGFKVLRTSGLYDAHQGEWLDRFEYLLFIEVNNTISVFLIEIMVQLCRHGFPTGDVYEYAAG